MKLPVFFAGSRLRVATETPHRFPGWAWDREMQGEGQEAACSSTLPRLLEIRAAARLSLLSGAAQVAEDGSKQDGNCCPLPGGILVPFSTEDNV